MNTRTIHDYNAFQERVTSQTRPGDYRLFPGQSFSHTRCVASTGPRPNRLHNNSEITQPKSWKGLADVENILSNRDTILSKSRDYRLMTDKRKRLYANELDYEPIECNNFLRPEDSRLTNNVQDYRGIYWGRMGNKGYPIRDPRVFVFDGHNETTQKTMPAENVRFGANSRLEFRDNYQMRLPIMIPDGVSPIPRRQNRPETVASEQNKKPVRK
jgi:hypothetical protein